MLESITVRDCATYDADGVEITDLKKINFIYGVNGSGKTTITKFVANPTDPQYGSCSKVWKNGVRIKALVYNKDFREENFGKGSIEGVFTLGKASKDEIEEINKLQAELANVKSEGIDKKSTIERLEVDKEQAENNFKEEAWKDVYTKHKAHFAGAFTGVKSSKDSFKKKLLEEFSKNSLTLESFDDLKEKADTILDTEPVQLTLIPVCDFARLTEIETDPIWAKRIIGKADVEIAELIQKLNLNDWLNQGREFLQDDETCPFCQQSTITIDFRKQLEDYFDEAFTNDTKLVKSLSEEYERLSAELIENLESIETDEKEIADSKLDQMRFSASLKTFISQLVTNKEKINTKIKESSRSIDLLPTSSQTDELKAQVIEANEQITKHNALVANYTKEKALLISQIWKYLIEEYRNNIEAFNKKINGLQTGIEKLINEKAELGNTYKELEEKIRIKNKNVTSVQPSVDEINRTLKSFGFTNFEIVPSSTEKNQYQVQREDGSIAEATLSEGEITFITFLYFLQLCKGSTSAENITQERVLVIDDPISSLDSNVLFVVSTLIKEVIKQVRAGTGNIRQIILLTHNVYFHKEASFINSRETRNGDTHFWILRRNKNKTTVQSFGKENPIKSSYELLWQELRNRDHNSVTTIQNTMRRIIEHYFKILGKFGDHELIDCFSDAEEKEICRSLLCWINDGSHTIPDDLYVEHQGDTSDKYFAVFERIFEQTQHHEHYKMMMGQALMETKVA